MAVIKSAVEIALEKTQEVEANRESLEANRYGTEGKKAVSRFFSDEQQDLKALLSAYQGKQRKWVREGALQALLANLKLPVDELSLLQAKRTGQGLHALADDTKRQRKLLSQMAQFLQDFLQERKRVVEAVDQRFAPVLRQKEEQLSRQMGARVRIDPAMDPDYQKLLRENLAILEDRYNQVLEQVRQELRRMCE